MRKLANLLSAAVLAAGLAIAAAAPTTAAGPNDYSSPEWLPLRGDMVVGCTYKTTATS